MKRLALLVPLLLAAPASAAPSVRSAKPPTHQAALISALARRLPINHWYAIFIGGIRSGYLHDNGALTSHNGRSAVLVSQDTKAYVPGTTQVAIDSRSRRWYTLTGQEMEQRETRETDGQGVTQRRVIFSAKSVIVETEEPGKARTRRTLTRRQYDAEDRRQSAGPFSMSSLDLLNSKRGAREVITVGWRPVEAFRASTLPLKDGSRVTRWINAKSELLRMDVSVSGVEFRMERVSRDQALAPLTVAPPDTSIIATEQKLDAPRNMRVARYYLTGLIDAPAVTDDDVQTLTATRQPDGRYTAAVSVAVGPASDAPPLRLADIPRVRFAAQLQPGKLTPAESAEMTALAKQIVGDEKDARRAAEKLDRWVHENISYDWDYSGWRSAAQTLKDRRGVCQNYTTLLVTLARAAGIPAKYCAGPAYIDGKYFAHAWVELWVGRWVAFEPAWGTPFADAARIKLVEGEPDAPLNSWNTNAPPVIRHLTAGEAFPVPNIAGNAPPTAQP